jgi:hypothetical protein
MTRDAQSLFPAATLLHLCLPFARAAAIIPRMTQQTHAHPEHSSETFGEPISLSHFVRTLRDYRVVIILTLTATAILYALGVVVVVLASPTERVTSQSFRLDFEGAATGKFPNGLRFSTSDIVSPPVLLPVFRRNGLERYVSFPNFSRSIFVLESNPAYDILSAEYQSRLADPRVSPVDRERLLKEFEQKRDAIAKNEYTINYVRFERIGKIPEQILRKVLTETLTSWSDDAVKNQDVLAYRISVLSPEILNATVAERSDQIVSALMLRNRTIRLLDNLAELRKLPGADLVRAGADRMSLDEVRLRLEEILRYRIEPVVTRLQASGATTPATLRFLQDQLAYDQRKLAAAKKMADSYQATLAVYQQTPPQVSRPETASSQPPARPAGAGETVMPQISDTFLDRIVDLVGKSADTQYRQHLVDGCRETMEAVIPIEQAVSYDTSLLGNAKGGLTAGSADRTAISSEIEGIRTDLRSLVVAMNDIYRGISRNVYSTSQLVTLTAPPSTRVAHAVDPVRLLLWGIVVMLIALPLTVIGCLLHNRVREEESQAEEFAGA